MWVEEQANGKFKFVEQYKDEMTGKKKRVSVTLDKNTTSTRRTALEQLNQKISDAHGVVPVENITLFDLVERYRVYQSKTVRPSTYMRNFHACNALIRILGEDTYVSKLTAVYIKDSFLSTGDSLNTLNERRTRLKALLNWGFENDYIDDVSFLKKFKPFASTPHKKSIQDKFLESNEANKILDYMANKNMWHWWYITKLMLLSGIRIGEAIALTFSDIDEAESVIRISKTYDPLDRSVGPPKTLCSIRDIYMQDDLFKLIKKIKSFAIRHALENNYDNNFKLLFCSKTGDAVNYYGYNDYLKESSIASIGRPITTHVLRHTHASLLFEQGVDIESISRRLGHENSVVTRQIYLHVTKKLKNKDNKQIKSLKII